MVVSVDGLAAVLTLAWLGVVIAAWNRKAMQSKRNVQVVEFECQLNYNAIEDA